jgi:hypothetical protein
MTGAWSSPNDWLACLVGWAYDWQTLITGALAILAAWIAARPGWRQLKSLQLQSEATARETLITRVTAMESRRETTRHKMQHIKDEFSHYDELLEDINPHAAFSLEGVVDAATAFLIGHQEASLDGEVIDTARQAVLQQTKAASTPPKPICNSASCSRSSCSPNW